jgi:hypothetical protein
VQETHVQRAPAKHEDACTAVFVISRGACGVDKVEEGLDLLVILARVNVATGGLE